MWQMASQYARVHIKGFLGTPDYILRINLKPYCLPLSRRCALLPDFELSCLRKEPAILRGLFYLNRERESLERFTKICAGAARLHEERDKAERKRSGFTDAPRTAPLFQDIARFPM